MVHPVGSVVTLTGNAVLQAGERWTKPLLLLGRGRLTKLPLLPGSEAPTPPRRHLSDAGFGERKKPCSSCRDTSYWTPELVGENVM